MKKADTALGIEIDWVGFAEGSVLDARQAITLVGFNQVLVSAEDLPFRWQGQVIVIAREPEGAADESASGLVTVTLKDPSGNVVGAITNTVNVSRKHPDVPASVIMALAAGIEISEYGRLVVEATAHDKQGGPVMSRSSQSLYVVHDDGTADHDSRSAAKSQAG